MPDLSDYMGDQDLDDSSSGLTNTERMEKIKELSDEIAANHKLKDCWSNCKDGCSCSIRNITQVHGE